MPGKDRRIGSGIFEINIIVKTTEAAKAVIKTANFKLINLP